jgi:hypothetical protein
MKKRIIGREREIKEIKNNRRGGRRKTGGERVERR